MKKTLTIIILLLGNYFTYSQGPLEKSYIQKFIEADPEFNIDSLYGDLTITPQLILFNTDIVYTDTIKWIHNDEVYEILLTDDCSEREKLDLDIPLWLYLMYEEECFNDTIVPDGCELYFTKKVLSVGGLRGVGGVLYDHADGVFHKQPTFKGFLLWVKDKLKL